MNSGVERVVSLVRKARMVYILLIEDGAVLDRFLLTYYYTLHVLRHEHIVGPCGSMSTCCWYHL